MNLIIDVGNTSTKLAVFDGNALVKAFSEKGQAMKNLPRIISAYAIERAVVASVVDLCPGTLKKLHNLSFPVLWVDKDTPLPIVNLYKTPETLGYDRIAAVVEANGQLPGHDILVIDIGTAINYEFIDKKGQYHGGNISPGIEMRFKALNQYTSRLPLLSTKKGGVPVVGADTEAAIRSGVLRGIMYEIEGNIMYLMDKYPELLIFLTGGREFSFVSNLKNTIFADKFLVLKGLNRILNYNNDRI